MPRATLDLCTEPEPASRSTTIYEYMNTKQNSEFRFETKRVENPENIC